MTIMDDLIERYLAGSLEGDALKDFEKRREEDPVLEERLLRCREMESVIRNAAQEIDAVPLSADLQALVQKVERGKHIAVTAPVRSGGAKVSNWLAGLLPPPVWATGAALAASALAFVLFGLPSKAPLKNEAIVLAGANVSALADYLPSGAVEDGVTFTGSFQRDGETIICRVFQIKAADTPSGLVCADGADWTLVAFTERPKQAYSPAGTRSDLIAAHLVGMARLSPTDEAVFLAKR